MCSLHLTHPNWSSGEPTVRQFWGISALLKGLTSVVDTSCQSRDLNPQPWVISGFKSNALSTRPRLLQSKIKASQLPPHHSSDCLIELLPGATLPKGRIFPLSQPEA